MREDDLSNNYSADVRISIDCGPHGVVPLAHASRDFVIAAKPATIPPCGAKIILLIDAHRIERPVRLISGMSPDRPEAEVAAHAEVVAAAPTI